MNQPSPCRDFNFLTKKEINEFCLDSISENSPIGYILVMNYMIFIMTNLYVQKNVKLV